MIPTIARRLNLNREDSQRLEFLVRRHLDMAHISQRRDLHDDRLIQDFAQQHGDERKSAHALSADLCRHQGGRSRTSGPSGRGSLLQELYEKAYEVLERGDFYKDLRSERVRNRQRKVLEALARSYGERPVRELLQAAGHPLHPFASFRGDHRAPAARTAARRGAVAIDVTADHDSGFSRVVVSTLDVPGLFSMIAGVMAANGINILGAQIYTRSNGSALDILHVNNPQGGVIDNPAKWARVRRGVAGGHRRAPQGRAAGGAAQKFRLCRHSPASLAIRTGSNSTSTSPANTRSSISSPTTGSACSTGSPAPSPNSGCTSM